MARRYAKALLSLGEDEGRLDALTREVRSLGDAVASSAELRTLLASPVIPQESRHAVMSDIAARLGCETAAVKAVVETEVAIRGPYDSQGRPTILFERHVWLIRRYALLLRPEGEAETD